MCFPKARKLFRGIAGMALPQQVLDAGSFVELAYTSATPDHAVAKEYAGSDRSSLFEIEVGCIDRGAFIGEYSQYEAEEEHVLAPLAHYEIIGKRREGTINIYTLRLNVNGKTETLEELREDRRTQALEVAQKLNGDFLQLTGRDSLQMAKIVKTEVEPVGYEWFNQARNFTQILAKLEDTVVQEMGEEEESLRNSADALPADAPAPERVDKLRTCVKLVERISPGDAAGKKALLTAQERLVEAVTAPGPGSMASTSAAADDMVQLADQLENTSSDFVRALDMLERAMGVQRALNPPAPPAEVALVLHRQGRVMWRMGRFDEALVRYRESLDLRVQVCCPRMSCSHYDFYCC